MAVAVRRVLNVCRGTLKQVKAVQTSVTEAIHDAIEKRALEEGHMTSSRLHELLQTYQDNLSTLVTNQLSSFRTDIIDNIGRAENVDNNIVHNPSDEDEGSIPDATGLERTLYQSYNYNGKLGYHVPSAFALPQKTNLRNAWTLWWLGCRTAEGSIRPFMLLRPEYLPKQVRNEFRINWQPILSLMTSGLVGPHQPTSAEWLNNAYVQGLEHVKRKASYIFNGRQDKLTVASWSKKICQSEIKKHGTDADKLLLTTSGNPTTHHQQSRVCQKKKS